MGLELTLIRHGESETNAFSKFNAFMIGASPWIELTANGIEQSGRLGQYFRGTEFDKIFCSTAIRAQQTARYCLNQMWELWPKYELAPELAELNQGNLEGTLRIDAMSSEQKEQIIDWWTHKLSNGESQEDVYNRVESFVKRKVLGKGYNKVAFFTHGNAIKCFLTGALDLDTEEAYRMQIDNGSLTVLNYNDILEVGVRNYKPGLRGVNCAKA